MITNKNSYDNLISLFGKEVKRSYPEITIHKITPAAIVFNDATKIKCFYCKNYNKKWCCPPRIPSVDYAAIVRKYNNAVILEYNMFCDESSFEDVRVTTTNNLHRSLLIIEKILWEANEYMSLSFMGGSCKLCKGGCDEKECKNKGLMRISMEAATIDVIQTLKIIDCDVVFLKSRITRYGLVVW